MSSSCSPSVSVPSRSLWSFIPTLSPYLFTHYFFYKLLIVPLSFQNFYLYTCLPTLLLFHLLVSIYAYRIIRRLSTSAYSRRKALLASRAPPFNTSGWPLNYKDDNISTLKRTGQHDHSIRTIFKEIPFQPICPFVNPGWLIDDRECLRLSIASSTLLPCRFIWFSTCFLIGWASSKFAVFRTPFEADPTHPQTPLKRWLNHYCIKLMSRCALFALGYYWIEERGQPDKGAMPSVWLSNHSSFLDSFWFLFRIVPSPVGAHEHMSIPLLGTVVRGLQGIFVDRNDKYSRMSVIESIRRRCVEINRWPPTLIFPEGTCANGHVLCQFKNGAFLPGVPVQPIYISYQRRVVNHSSHSHYDSDSNSDSSYYYHPSWVNFGSPILFNLFRLGCEPIQYLHITYLPVYSPSIEEKKDATLYARNVTHMMSRTIKVPVTLHSYEDVILQQQVANGIMKKRSTSTSSSSFPRHPHKLNNLTPDTTVVEYSLLKSRFSSWLDLPFIQESLADYMASDTYANGRLSAKEFIHSLRVMGKTGEKSCGSDEQGGGPSTASCGLTCDRFDGILEWLVRECGNECESIDCVYRGSDNELSLDFRQFVIARCVLHTVNLKMGKDMDDYDFIAELRTADTNEWIEVVLTILFCLYCIDVDDKKVLDDATVRKMIESLEGIVTPKCIRSLYENAISQSPATRFSSLRATIRASC